MLEKMRRRQLVEEHLLEDKKVWDRKSDCEFSDF